MKAELIIRGGTIVDGSGAAPFVGDVAIIGGRIVGVGTFDHIDTNEAEVIDAVGCIVTPGFVDIHTHYDGQAIWSDRMEPSSCHGVTTAVMGNCGVGFAPCREQDHETLVKIMEGVEDIPGAVMAEGLAWDWETFGEYLDALDRRPRDIDVAAYLPHSPLRVYVMGERGANREAATPEDLATMRSLAREAIEAGALGCATSRLFIHRTSAGQLIPSYGSEEQELDALAQGILEGGGGVFQLVADYGASTLEEEVEVIAGVGKRNKVPITFTLSLSSGAARTIELLDELVTRGVEVHAQIFPRPVGMIIGLNLTWNPFSFCPSYGRLTKMPVTERVAEMRKPEVRAALVAEEPDFTKFPLATHTRCFDRMFPLEAKPNYEPKPDESIAARAAEAGVTPAEYVYDQLLEDDAQTMLLVAMGNYSQGSLDAVRTVMDHPIVVLGLGDGGAHYGLVCDASYPTFVLQHWVQERSHGRVSLPWAVNALSRRPAEVVGLNDRGIIGAGYRADLNVIDLEQLSLEKPVVVHDLPAGGKRLMQRAVGFRATIVHGRVIARDGKPTGALPGKLVRGRQADPCHTSELAAAG